MVGQVKLEDEPQEEHPEHKLRHALMLIGTLICLAKLVHCLMAM